MKFITATFWVLFILPFLPIFIIFIIIYGFISVQKGYTMEEAMGLMMQRTYESMNHIYIITTMIWIYIIFLIN
jgi:hypothetical protein